MASASSPVTRESLSISHGLPSFAHPRDPSSPSAVASTSQLVTPHALNLSLPYAPQSDPYIDVLPYQLLLAEMPATLKHSSLRAIRRREKLLAEIEESGMKVDRGSTTGGFAGSKDSSTTITKGNHEELETETEARLEQIGIVVGANLTER